MEANKIVGYLTCRISSRSSEPLRARVGYSTEYGQVSLEITGTK
jgi:hypothetical protein